MVRDTKDFVAKNRLKDILAQRGLSQADLCRLTGFGKDQISRLCNNVKTNIFLSRAIRICEVLKVGLDDVFYDIKKVGQGYLIIDEKGGFDFKTRISPADKDMSDNGFTTIIRTIDLKKYHEGEWIFLN